VIAQAFIYPIKRHIGTARRARVYSNSYAMHRFSRLSSAPMKGVDIFTFRQIWKTKNEEDGQRGNWRGGKGREPTQMFDTFLVLEYLSILENIPPIPHCLLFDKFSFVIVTPGYPNRLAIPQILKIFHFPRYMITIFKTTRTNSQSTGEGEEMGHASRAIFHNRMNIYIRIPTHISPRSLSKITRRCAESAQNG
jgi:hypothetical protein